MFKTDREAEKAARKVWDNAPIMLVFTNLDKYELHDITERFCGGRGPMYYCRELEVNNETFTVVFTKYKDRSEHTPTHRLAFRSVFVEFNSLHEPEEESSLFAAPTKDKETPALFG